MEIHMHLFVGEEKKKRKVAVRAERDQSMEVEKVLRMNGGVGPTSYAGNSLMQRTIFEKTKHVIKENIEELYHTIQPDCLVMTDLGCATGTNSLELISKAIKIVNTACQKLNCRVPEFEVFLNDLPSNDFNTVFTSLPKFYKKLEDERGTELGQCFVYGTPGSFYGRLFPSKFVHFVHSLYSLHWLSRIPRELVSDNGEALNKGNICIAQTSPLAVWKAYYKQFESDFMLFLMSRSKEIIFEGRMVLTFIGSTKSNDPHYLMYIGNILNSMASEGLIERQKLDMFNLPFYNPTVEEVRKLIEEEGSFTLHKLETFTLEWDIGCNSSNPNVRAKFLANSIRAVTESMLAKEFGGSIMNELFFRFQELLVGIFATGKTEFLNIVVSLIRKASNFNVNA